MSGEDITMDNSKDDEIYTSILERLEKIEDQINKITNKLLFSRKENHALEKRITVLEKENESLRNKRNITVSLLRDILGKFEDAGY